MSILYHELRKIEQSKAKELVRRDDDECFLMIHVERCKNIKIFLYKAKSGRIHGISINQAMVRK